MVVLAVVSATVVLGFSVVAEVGLRVETFGVVLVTHAVVGLAVVTLEVLLSGDGFVGAEGVAA